MTRSQYAVWVFKKDAHYVLHVLRGITEYDWADKYWREHIKDYFE